MFPLPPDFDPNEPTDRFLGGCLLLMVAFLPFALAGDLGILSSEVLSAVIGGGTLLLAIDAWFHDRGNVGCIGCLGLFGIIYLSAALAKPAVLIGIITLLIGSAVWQHEAKCSKQERQRRQEEELREKREQRQREERQRYEEEARRQREEQREEQRRRREEYRRWHEQYSRDEEEFRRWEEQQQRRDEERRRQQEQRWQQEQQRRQEEERRREEEQRRRRESRNRQEQQRASSTPSEDAYYHEILGTKPGMSFDEIKKAYRQKVMQYHPDKVNHLGEKLKEFAEQEMKKINEAYNYFEQKYK